MEVAVAELGEDSLANRGLCVLPAQLWPLLSTHLLACLRIQHAEKSILVRAVEPAQDPKQNNARFAQDWLAKQQQRAKQPTPTLNEASPSTQSLYIELDSADRETLGVKKGDRVWVEVVTGAYRLPVWDVVVVHLQGEKPKNHGHTSTNEHLLPPDRFVKSHLLYRTLCRGSVVCLQLRDGTSVPFVCWPKLAITGTHSQPAGIGLEGWGWVDERTDVVVSADPPPADDVNMGIEKTLSTYALDYHQLRDIMRLGLVDFGLCLRKGVAPPKLILVNGPQGTGKTTAIELLASEFGASVFHLDPLILDLDQGGPKDAGLCKLFQRAGRCRPSILFVDNAHLLFPAGLDLAEEDGGLLLKFIDLAKSIPADKGMVVAAATCDIKRLHSAVRAAFQDQVAISMPRGQHLINLLQLLTKNMILDGFTASDLTELCTGLSGAAIQAICTRVQCIADAINSTEKPCDANNGAQCPVTMAHFEKAAGVVRSADGENEHMARPSAGKVGWGDVGGLDLVRERLEDAVLAYFRMRDTYERLGITPSHGVLLYGPPGTGKTLVARALAGEARVRFISVTIPSIVQSEVGESEKRLAALFAEARQSAPCILFFDEMQALFGSRATAGTNMSKLVSQLCLEMDALALCPGVVVLAATNAPESIDLGLLRPGRLEDIVFVPPPDRQAREHILSILLQRVAHDPTVSASWLAWQTEGYTGADLTALMRNAAVVAMRRALGTGSTDRTEDVLACTTITPADISEALSSSRPSVTQTQAERYVRWAESIRPTNQMGGAKNRKKPHPDQPDDWVDASSEGEWMSTDEEDACL